MNDFSNQLPTILDQIIASIPVFKPELILIIAFIGAILATLFFDKIWKHSSFVVASLGIIISLTVTVSQINNPTSGFFEMLVIDNFAVYARVIIQLALLVVILLIQQFFKNKTFGKNLGDIYSILLTAGLGLNLLTVTTNWLLVFIAIETVSISSYILVGYFSETKRQAEAAMKYVLFGSVCAAIMLYGISLLYGFTGNLDFASQAHIQGLISAPPVMISIALLFMFVGIGFKLGFVPFHMWTPDVYEGAPTPITAFLSTVPKIGAIVLLSRLFQAWVTSSFYFSELTLLFVTAVAIVTMLVGNLIALRQTDIKRMMAYSSIGHTGFLLMAVISTQSKDPQILLFYLAVYTLMNFGIFALVQTLEEKIGTTTIADYAGLGKTYPLLFTVFTFIGISLVGLPPTAGFIGKLLVFTSTFEVYQTTKDLPFLILLIVGALTSVISLFYYFRIPLYAFLRKGDERQNPRISLTLTYSIGIIFGFLVLLLGIFPDFLLQLFN